MHGNSMIALRHKPFLACAFGIALATGLTGWPMLLGAAPHPSRGLWVGEVTLNKVNEVVVGINAANQVVAPDPNVPTPTADSAHIRLILHVNAAGQVRLLKSVSAVNKSQANPTPDIALITDDSLLPNFPGLGKRFSAVAFDFGDVDAVNAVDHVVALTANAAATSANLGNGLSTVLAAATTAANTAVTDASAILATASPGYAAFIASQTFTGTASKAANAAANAAVAAKAVAGNTLNDIKDAATLAAVKALAVAFSTADAVLLNEVKMTGSLAPGGTVTGTLFLGENHPTNPFRHRRHPDHTTGYEINRSLTLTVNQPADNKPFEPGGFGVDRLTGVYKEEIQGLHKPLGPAKNIGLKTEGVFTLNRVSLVDTLNQ